MASLLDRLIPTPRLLEVDRVDLAAPPERVWELARHGDLARSPLVRAFFALRAIPERLAGTHQPSKLRLDELCSSPEKPGFSVLLENPRREVAVGAIGKVWQPVIAFQHVSDASAFLDFCTPNQVKVAWSVRTLPLGDRGCRLEIEVRVDATDDAAWRKFERYFRLIGPCSRLIRRVLLSGLARELGTSESGEAARPLPGDELLPAAKAEETDGITLEATPEQITRLHVRAHVAFPESAAFHALWMRPVHHFMQHEMLEHLAARVEQRLPRDDYGEQRRPARAVIDV